MALPAGAIRTRRLLAPHTSTCRTVPSGAVKCSGFAAAKVAIVNGTEKCIVHGGEREKWWARVNLKKEEVQ